MKTKTKYIIFFVIIFTLLLFFFLLKKKDNVISGCKIDTDCKINQLCINNICIDNVIPNDSYFKVYVEDCQDDFKELTYNMEKILKLDIFVIDFTKVCYDNNNTILGNLISKKFTGKILVHIDQTTGIACNINPEPEKPHIRKQANFNSCITNLKLLLSKNNNNEAFIDGLLWEKEGNRIMNFCGEKIDDGFEGERITCKDAFNTAFGRPILFAGWSYFEKAWGDKTKLYDYNFIEMYNIYTKNCNVNNDSCYVDYTEKPYLNCTSYNDCNCSNDNTCNVYYNTNITPEERAIWFCKIIMEYKNEEIKTVPDNTVIFFPFTSASKPSFKYTITTEEDFNKFINTFINLLKSSFIDIEKAKFGTWGCPLWILK